MKRSAIEMALVMAAGAILTTFPMTLGSEPISPDRPGLVNSPDTVGSGTLQIEVGGQRDRYFSGSELDYTARGPFTIRYGLGDSFEFRLEGDGYTAARFRRKDSLYLQLTEPSAPALSSPFAPQPGFSLVSNPEDLFNLLVSGTGPLPRLRFSAPTNLPLDAGFNALLDPRAFLHFEEDYHLNYMTLGTPSVGPLTSNLRLSGPNLILPERAEGMSDTTFGFKYTIIDQNGWVPATG
ncbi:MAG: hypothetical protein K1X70_19675 [Leptospirales bacterium]|nr:hypothetical protein [Leptospirales bacterium]